MTHIGNSLFKILVNNSDIKVYQISIHGKKLNYDKPYSILYYSDHNLIDNNTEVTIQNINPGDLIKNELPSYLTKLLISVECNMSKYSFDLNNLPCELKKLKINNINLELNNLPTSLHFLEIKGNYTKKLDNLPSSLKVLILERYSKNLDDLPSSLESLIILNKYSNQIKNLPYGLKNFVFADEDNYNINLPPNIKNVWFDDSNNALRRKLLKINPKVCYNDLKSSKIYIENFCDDVMCCSNNTNNKCEMYHLNKYDLDECYSDECYSDECDSDEYNDGDNFNHNVLI